MLSSVGLSIFTVSDGHFGTKNFNTTDHAKSLYFVTKSRKNANLCVRLVEFGLGKFCVSDIEWRHRVWSQLRAGVILKRKEL